MENQIDANINNVNCLVTKTHFGYDTVINICANTVRDIEWAFGDWMLVLLFAGLGIVMFAAVIMIAATAVSMWRGY